MAMTGLDIYKLTPKSNCKDCGFPTCMAFSMKVATGGAEISKCPHMNEESLAKLAESTAPLMKAVSCGRGDAEYKLGGETVLFRHDKTFVNRNRFALLLSDSMAEEAVDARIARMKEVNYVRIGEEMKVEFVALAYTGNKTGYIALINKVIASGVKPAYMLICDEIPVLQEALKLVGDEIPIVYGATKDNYQDMAAIVKAKKLPLGLKAANLPELYELVENVQRLGCKELLLDPGSSSMKEAFTNTVQIRRTALKEQDRTFGYPSILFVNELASGEKFMEVALSSLFTLRYGSLIVLSDIDYARALPLFGLRQNIFTDPQKPMRVEPKVYPVNNPGENSPLLITVDFALTYFVVSGEVERSKVPAWLGVPDAGGYSVLTAWAAGKFGGSVIANFIAESGAENITRCRKLVIPGRVAVLKGDIEDYLPGWEVIVGPEEAMYLPKFLKSLEGIN